MIYYLILSFIIFLFFSIIIVNEERFIELNTLIVVGMLSLVWPLGLLLYFIEQVLQYGDKIIYDKRELSPDVKFQKELGKIIRGTFLQRLFTKKEKSCNK